MANPAWVVRARRARSRRRSRVAAIRGQLPRIFAHICSPQVWAIWLFYLLYPLAPRSPGALRAAESARAVLDGSAFAGQVMPPSSPLPSPRNAVALVWHQVSLRAAAHLVTVAIVLMVALWAKDVVVRRDQNAALAQVARVAGQSPADLQVGRSMTPFSALDVRDLAVPSARTPSDDTLPVFTESHTLVEGETLGQVAAQYQVSAATIFWTNDLGSGNVFAAGQKLRIPRLSGAPHIVAEGDTVESIAKQFRVSPQAIILFKPNGLRAGAPLSVGQDIFIPGGTPPDASEILARYGGAQAIPSLRAVAAGTVQEEETNLRAGPSREYPKLGTLDAGRRLKLIARHEQWVKVEDGPGRVGWVRRDLLGLSEVTTATLPETNDFPPLPPRWVWPTRGEITSTFGWRSLPFRSFSDGLDIANSAWTEIRAARTGRISEAGWCSGFGYCVKIDHGDGVMTIYGHMIKRPPVKAGESVDAGDLIGYMGSTYDRSGGGYSTGVHLHFTVKVNGKAVNPLKFLP